jgi:hypothetical protein
MVKERNSARNSVLKTGEVKLFDTIPVPRLTPEIILTHHEAPWVFDMAVLGMLEH